MYFLARLLIRSSAICFQCALLHIIIILFFLFVCACSMYYKTVHVCTILYVHERLFRCIDNLALFRTHADIKTHAPLFSLLLPIYINIISCVWTFMPIQNHFYLVVLCLFWRNIEESTKCFANTHNSVVYFASGDARSV